MFSLYLLHVRVVLIQIGFALLNPREEEPDQVGYAGGGITHQQRQTGDLQSVQLFSSGIPYLQTEKRPHVTVLTAHSRESSPRTCRRLVVIGALQTVEAEKVAVAAAGKAAVKLSRHLDTIALLHVLCFMHEGAESGGPVAPLVQGALSCCLHCRTDDIVRGFRQ